MNQHVVPFISVCQPVVQQLKTLFDEVKEDFQTQDLRLDAKIDTLISLQKEKLAFEKEIQKKHMYLEREKLNFERQKVGHEPLPLPSASGDCINSSFG